MFNETWNYQEITVSNLDEIYKISKAYNDYHKLPRLISNGSDEYLKAYYRGQKMPNGQ